MRYITQIKNSCHINKLHVCDVRCATSHFLDLPPQKTPENKVTPSFRKLFFRNWQKLWMNCN